jgi:hypothetical protein
MTRRTSAQAFADVAAAMVDDVHVGDILARLLADCAEVVDARAVAILVTDRRDRLALLSSTSAVAADLEMLQVQDEEGPCVEAVRTGEIVSANSPDMVGRWGKVGATIVAAGFASVEAYPLRWRGRALGGLNVFRESPHERSLEVDALTQAFSDVATIALLHSTDLTSHQVTARVHEAVVARSTIEQAKGVLRELEGVDLETAARRLREMAAAEDTSLREAALRVLDSAQRSRT